MNYTKTLHNHNRKLLFLSRWFPFPPDNGSRVRIYNLLKQLSCEFEITLVTFCDPDQGNEETIRELRSICSEVYPVPTPSESLSGIKPTLAFFSPLPRWIVASDSPEIRNLLKKLAGQKYDLCLASQIDMARYALEISNCPRVLEELEISVITERPGRETHLIRKIRSGLTAQKYRRYLARIVRQFEGVTTVSTVERAAILRAIPGVKHPTVIPNGVDLAHYKGVKQKPEANTLVFTGALSYHANLDAIDYFLGEIFPAILREAPGTRLKVTGKTNPDQMEKLSLAGYSAGEITFTGYLADIRPAIAQSWASIVPLRVGGGTRLKILESLAAGTPVVTTAKGMQGLDLMPEKHILVGDSPAEFSAAVIRLLRDADLRDELSERGKEIVAQRYGWEKIGNELRDYLNSFLVD
ncbi:MAG TPA: glycosyltransferase family 4 protein [Anaerolineaceae bacterium]|nr:glycosyltransferase family 4 protein [Anaerolineaceae bacterium]